MLDAMKVLHTNELCHGDVSMDNVQVRWATSKPLKVMIQLGRLG
jgi:tRNA A-37 threonylcarbamoyl transferase component Bud32